MPGSDLDEADLRSHIAGIRAQLDELVNNLTHDSQARVAARIFWPLVQELRVAGLGSGLDQDGYSDLSWALLGTVLGGTKT